MDFTVKWYDVVKSTNDICMQQAKIGAAEGLVVAAYFQEQGRGQRGNTWESESHQNLTFSILVRPVFLGVEEQFLISKVIAVSVCDWIGAHLPGDKVAIKWPNDIYIDNSKVAGILIENSFSSSRLDLSVIGVGINLNQTHFPGDLPNPTSMLLEAQKLFNITSSLDEVISCFNARYAQLQSGDTEILGSDYFGRLYRHDMYYTYMANGDEFRARIVGVKPTGELILRTIDGKEQFFAFKELSFVI